MSIIGVRTESTLASATGLKCTALNHLSNGTASGESNKITASVATASLGKSLDATGNPALARKIIMATMTRQKAI